jgi:hypothetical protein
VTCAHLMATLSCMLILVLGNLLGAIVRVRMQRPSSVSYALASSTCLQQYSSMLAALLPACLSP